MTSIVSLVRHALEQDDERLKLTQAAMRRLSVRLPPQLEQRKILEAIEEVFSRLDAVEGHHCLP